jgi:CRISPR-associated protein Cas1
MSSAPLPDLLPARMLNEFVYCPRLFYYEWVEGLFAENTETVEGAIRHAKVDKEPAKFPTADNAAASGDGETIHGRSITLSSERHRLIAKIDMVEGERSAGVPPVVSPVDYKRGTPRATDEGIELWDTDRMQLAAQALVLRENGYRCEEGIVYYVATRQRVRLPITDELIAETLAQIERARAVAASGRIPSPLVNSPKCPRCSLVGICLPDETRLSMELPEVVGDSFEEPRAEQLDLFPQNPQPKTAFPPRRLIPARDDLRPVYLNTPGLRVGISGGVLQVKERDKLLHEIRLGEICQLNLHGNIQLTTQAIHALCSEEIPIAYFSMGGWFYGITRGMGLKNIFLRREQFRHADLPPFCLTFARSLVAGKIQNQRTMLQRNHVEPPTPALLALKRLIAEARAADSLETLLGIEGHASRLYFENFAGMIKLDEGDEGRGAGVEPQKTTAPVADAARRQSGVPAVAGAEPAATRHSPLAARPSPQFTFDFINRNRRPPRDAVNALLSLAYSILAKDLAITCLAVGFDPYLGFYHQPRFGRPALALDLMEPFRPLIADSAVLSAINNRMITPGDFVQVGPAVMLKPEGRKAFFRAYEQRMDTLVTHSLFGYRVNYRRVLEIQTRLLARLLTREIPRYVAFVTR